MVVDILHGKDGDSRLNDDRPSTLSESTTVIAHINITMVVLGHFVLRVRSKYGTEGQTDGRTGKTLIRTAA